MKYRIVLKLSYYDFKYLNFLIENLFSIVTNFFDNKICIVKKLDFPIRSNIITVLRSPHVAKKSREQFKRSIYSKGIVFQINKKNLFNFIYYFLLKILPFLNCKYNLNIFIKHVK